MPIIIVLFVLLTIFQKYLPGLLYGRGYVTSGIADSKVWATGWEAMRLGIAAFLIPFAFVFNPGLLMVGSVVDIVTAIVTALIGASLLAAGIRGYAFGMINIAQRIMLMTGGLLLIAPGITLPLIGLGVTVVALVPNFLTMRAAKYKN